MENPTGRLRGPAARRADAVAIPAPPPGATTRHFHVLDALRGVCALLVVLYHYPVVSHVSPLGFIRGGYMFVDFFFVLSGFVIAWSYGQRIDTAQSLLVFLVRRFFRLWPLHLFVLGLYLVVELAATPAGATLGARNGRTLPDLVRTLTLTNGFGMDHQSLWNIASWSISAEWWTYVAFGLLALVLGKRLSTGLAGMAALGAIMCVMVSDSIRITADYGVLRCCYGFGFGSLLAYHWPAVERRLAAIDRRALGIAEVALVIVIAAFVGAARLSPWSLLAPLVFAVAVAVFALEAGPVSRLLQRQFFVRAGLLSYSLYMVHQFVMGRVRNIAGFADARLGLEIDPGNAWHMDLLTLAVLALVWTTASLTWRFIEKPGQALGARIVARMQRPAKPA